MAAPALAGRRVLVTGGSMGIGRAVCQALAEADASVIVAARGADEVEATVASLPGRPHRGLRLDVASDSAWKEAMPEINTEPRLDGLVTAAGILGPIGRLDEIDPDAFRATIEVNLIGTMLALRYCIPALAAAGGAAVTFSGGGSTSPLPRYDAYAASKAAVVRLTENVARTAEEQGVRINCVAPGFVATRMHAATLAAGAERVGDDYYEKTRRQLDEGGVPARVAAELTCFLLGPEAAGITGKLISAPWDPWRESEFRQRLRTDRDLATLRRIDDQFFGRTPGS
jgi:NAD(P)-dependent dehydrogenase (short-subunit alcohol dehydrogenase family)